MANEDNARMLRLVRERTDVLVAFGDCAVSGNVTALRNPFGAPLPVLQRSYGPIRERIPGVGMNTEVPPLLTKVENLRALVPVDYYLPGCPPQADLIFFVLSELIAGRALNLQSRAKPG